MEDILYFNKFLSNGLAHNYHLGEYTFIFRGISNDFAFDSIFQLNFFKE